MKLSVTQAGPASTGLWLLMAVIGSLFFLLAAAYRMRMHLGGDWLSVAEPGILWINTAVLILSCVAMEWARRLYRGEQPLHDKVALAWFAAGLLAIMFLVGQLIAWLQMSTRGAGVADSPASSFFYLLSGMHAVHILGGLIAWARIGRPGRAASLGINLRLCCRYWHYLLLIWLGLFGLLLLT